MSPWQPMTWQTTLDAPSGVRIYRLAGVLTDADGGLDLIEQVRADIRVDRRPILLDLAGVEHMTSAGVGLVATIYTSALNAKLPIALCAPNHQPHLLLRIVYLLRVVPAFDDVPAALAALAAGGWRVMS